MNTILHRLLLVCRQILRHLEGVPIILSDWLKDLVHLINVHCILLLVRWLGVCLSQRDRRVGLLPLTIYLCFQSPNPRSHGAHIYVQFLWKSQSSFVEIWLLEWQHLRHRQFEDLLIHSLDTLWTKLFEPLLPNHSQLFIFAVSVVGCQNSNSLTSVNLS